MTDRDRLIYKVMSLKKPTISLQTAIDIVEAIIDEGVIMPPCKVGDIVYAKYSGTNEIEYYVVGEVIHLGSDNFKFKAYLENEDGYIVDNIDFGVKEIGKTVFLTKEEAEEKLKELNKNG